MSGRFSSNVEAILKPFAFTGPVVVALLLAGCSQRNEEKTAAALKASPSRSTNGQPVIAVDRATQTRMDLRTAVVAPTNCFREVQGFGRVLNPTPLSTLVLDLSSARAAAEVSLKELERLKTLAGQNNASLRALQAAEAAATRDQASVAADRQSLLANWGTGIARRPDLEAFVESLAAGETALVQLGLPAGERLQSPPMGARLVPISGEPVEGEYVGPAAAVDPELQGQGFLFAATNPGPDLKPGAAMTGWLRLSGKAIGGVTVPESAVVRFQEKAWVYVEREGTNFVRRPISLTPPLGNQNHWFIEKGLTPGDRIVVHGAASLLSEEQKAQIRLQD